MKIFTIFLSVILLTSLLAVIGSAGSGSSPATIAFADEELRGEKRQIDSASTVTTVAANPAGEVTAASGNNRFAAWYDNTPGNYEILFRRSTDSGATWQPTVNLSNNPGYSSVPQIAVSGANVYVLWSQQTTNSSLADVYVRVSKDNGATWGGKIKVSTSGTNFDPYPQIAVLGSNAYITWYDQGTSDIFLRRSTDNGTTWKAIANISNNAGESFYPQVAVSGSNVYVTWYDNTPGNYDILFKRSTDNGATWKAVVNISNNAGSSSGQQIAVSGANVYVTWSDTTDSTNGNPETLVRRSTDNGATWKAAVNISNSTGYSYNQQIAVSGANVYVTWSDDTDSAGNGEILLRRSTDNGATWKAVKNLSNNIGNSSVPQIKVSGANVYVTWYDDTTGNNEILVRRSTDNGATWKAVKNLSNNAGRSYAPQITIVGSDVYIVWVDNTPGNDDIFLRRSADNGATWKAVKNLSSNAGFSYLVPVG